MNNFCFKLIFVLLVFSIPLFGQGLLCLEFPAGVDNEEEMDCGCSPACFSDGICAPEGVGSCTEPGNSTVLTYETASMDLFIPSNSDVEITIVSLECSGDINIPGSFLESNDNFKIFTEKGTFDFKQQIYGGSYPSNFGNKVDEAVCYGTGSSSEVITVELRGNRKDECIEIDISVASNNGNPGSSGFSSACNILAVDLNSFTAHLNEDGQILVNWFVDRTSFETSRFLVEKQHKGLQSPVWLEDFENVEKDSGFVFIAMDGLPLPGENYYRLNITDQNDRVTHSKWIVVNYFKGGDLNIGNPIEEKLAGVVNSGESKANMKIFDLFGRLVKNWQQELEEDGSFSISVSDLNSGSYLLLVQLGGKPVAKPFIKI